MQTMFDQVVRDKSRTSRLEDVIGHLDEGHANDARAIVHVVQRILEGGTERGRELFRRFQSVKQCNAGA